MASRTALHAAASSSSPWPTLHFTVLKPAAFFSALCSSSSFCELREKTRRELRAGRAYAIVAISSGEPHGMECESWMVSRTRPPSRL